MDHEYALPYECSPEAISADRRNKNRILAAKTKTRVNIGFAFPRWRALRTKLGIEKDSDLALFLLDSLSKRRVREEPGTDLHNIVNDFKDSWETASESASDDDCVASISLRLCSRPVEDSDASGGETEEEEEEEEDEEEES